jgi:hypothetical protein
MAFAGSRVQNVLLNADAAPGASAARIRFRGESGICQDGYQRFHSRARFSTSYHPGML